jgi:DNA polymerase epsilon subunit 1
MKKVFWQLVAEFRKLGSRVVFANFNKIIICTTKTNLEDARAYTEFIVGNIRKKDLFRWIDIGVYYCCLF